MREGLRMGKAPEIAAAIRRKPLTSLAVGCLAITLFCGAIVFAFGSATGFDGQGAFIVLPFVLVGWWSLGSACIAGSIAALREGWAGVAALAAVVMFVILMSLLLRM